MKFRCSALLATLLLPSLYGARPDFPPLSERAAARILEQGTWGPTSADIASLQSQGLDPWLQAQFAAAVSTYTDQPLKNAKGNSNTDLTPVLREFFQNALTGPDQLRQRVAFALSEIWVISELEVNSAQAFPPLMRTFQSRAFDNYEDLMYDVSVNPGMGKFLNMVNNNKANPAKNTEPNENYSREVMQLFTLGLTQLYMDGRPVLDGNGNPQPTYTQADVSNLAKAFTGWTYPPMPSTASKTSNPSYFIGAMVPVQATHDTTAKTVLGSSLAAGQTPDAELRAALHIIFMQPTLAPFVSRQLIEHLVTSNPNVNYVQRVAGVFADNGSGVRGDLKAVITAILKDPDARAGDTPWDMNDRGFGHMKEPVLFTANLLRGLNATLSATTTVYNYPSSMGQSVFYAPSVFSYFSPQYQLGPDLYAPEFQIYSTQTASNRINDVNAVVYNGKLDAGTVFNLSNYVALGGDATKLLPAINQQFFHDAMSPALANAIVQGMSNVTSASDKAKAALYIALSSAEFQIVH